MLLSFIRCITYIICKECTMGFNAAELAMIFGIAVLLFGNRLPSVGKSVGEGIRNFKKGLAGEDEKEPSAEEPPSQNQSAALGATTQQPSSLQSADKVVKSSEKVVDVHPQ